MYFLQLHSTLILITNSSASFAFLVIASILCCSMYKCLLFTLQNNFSINYQVCEHILMPSVSSHLYLHHCLQIGSLLLLQIHFLHYGLVVEHHLQACHKGDNHYPKLHMTHVPHTLYLILGFISHNEPTNLVWKWMSFFWILFKHLLLYVITQIKQHGYT